VAKWRGRNTTLDRPTGPKQSRSTVLSIEEEAVIVAFRRHTLLPLDDCLYARQAHRFVSTHDQIVNVFARRPNQDAVTMSRYARNQSFLLLLGRRQVDGAGRYSARAAARHEILIVAQRCEENPR
jgi:hypothetical protein